MPLAAAKEVEADMEKTQEEVTAAAKALNDAIAALRKSVVTVAFADLDRELAAAEAAVAGATEIGEEAGKCPQAVVDALQAVITEAKNMDRAAVNQEAVDAMAAKFAQAVATFNTALVESTGISAVIAEANELLEEAETGFKLGNYPTSAVNGLNEAIQKALLVAENSESTQAELLAAVADLKAAMEAFKAQVIPAHDLTDIKAAIAEAEAFIAENGNDDVMLSIALDAAKDIVANPNDYTKSEVTKAHETLVKALELARQNSGIEGVAAEGLNVTANGGKLIVSGLNGKAIVAVYTLDGRMVVCEEVAEAIWSIDLSAGKYAVAVQAEGISVSRVVFVK